MDILLRGSECSHLREPVKPELPSSTAGVACDKASVGLEDGPLGEPGPAKLARTREGITEPG